MKSLKSIAVALCAMLVLAGCNMSNTAKGTMIGAGGCFGWQYGPRLRQGVLR